jgi:hypothetical protein
VYPDRKLKESDRVENFDLFLEKCCTQIKEKDSRKIPSVINITHFTPHTQSSQEIKL